MATDELSIPASCNMVFRRWAVKIANQGQASHTMVDSTRTAEIVLSTTRMVLRQYSDYCPTTTYYGTVVGLGPWSNFAFWWREKW